VKKGGGRQTSDLFGIAQLKGDRASRLLLKKFQGGGEKKEGRGTALCRPVIRPMTAGEKKGREKKGKRRPELLFYKNPEESVGGGKKEAGVILCPRTK